MSTAKELVREMLEEIPENATMEDIQYHIYVREKVDAGKEEVQKGRVISQEEAEQRMSRWLGK